MSDFPKGGDIEATRAWLDKKGLSGMFDGWEADALLGLERADIVTAAHGENGLKLWGFLNTAKQSTGNNQMFVFAGYIYLYLVFLDIFICTWCSWIYFYMYLVLLY